jgi:hypothetical protein
MTSEIDKTRENRLRRMAARQGLALHKGRSRTPGDVDDRGGYQIVNVYRNTIEGGERFSLSLDQVEEWLKA